MVHRAAIFCLASAALMLAGPARGEEDDRSKVLSLVSLEYRLDGKDHPRTHDLVAYLPLLRSGDAGILEVATLSVVWEEFTIVPHKAFKAQVNAVEGLFGGFHLEPPGAKDRDAALEAKMRDAEERLKGPLQEAIRHGALAAYDRKEILPAMSQGFDQGLKEGVSNVVEKQADYWQAQALLARMQDVLWDRAEALASRGAGRGGFDPAELTVSVQFEKRRGLVIQVRNRSAKDLNNVTLAARVTRRPIKKPSAGEDLALGGLLSLMSGEDDPKQAAKTAGTFARSTQGYWAIQERPIRIFLHVPVLPAGKEWSTKLLSSSMELAMADKASFSLWSDELKVESGKLEGFDALQEQAQKRLQEAARQRQAQRKTGLFGMPSPRPAAPARSGGSALAPSAPPAGRRPAAPGVNRLIPGGAQPGSAGLGAGLRRDPAPGRAASAPAGKPDRSDELLRQARSAAETNPTAAAASFRKVVSQYPDTPAAKEATDWLQGYPRRLLDRAAQLEENERTGSEAVRLYREVLKSAPDSTEAGEARKKLDALAERLSARAAEQERAGNRAGARLTYLRLLRDVPESPQATRARERLRSSNP